MRLIHASLLAGVAALGFCAFAPSALSKASAVHEMTVRLPGGGTEIIRYTGNIAPKVDIRPVPLGLVPLSPAWPAPVAFGFDPSFAALDRITADMDRQMDALWCRAWTMCWSGSGPGETVLSSPGPGTATYSVMLGSDGSNFCSRVTKVTVPENGGKPKVVSRTSGNCADGVAGAQVHASSAPSDVQTIAAHTVMPATATPRAAL